MRRRCDSSGVLQKINIPASTRPTAERVTAQRTKRLEKLDPGQSASLDFPITVKKESWRTDLGLIDLGLIDFGLIDLGNDRRGGEGGSTI
jgi:hypothetical protein